ncbi:unnamed protein product [Acanthoscelides obtectus]|uniref:Carbohydrate kinase FGGY N-terminal domain-containing protein n=1 Tax=Acanthoscelides obtectus TaxID=200917 RepID=A0A9P0P343_ACAOB|nr:unnamed protein product [Acanthoscelides obtectus]CAK1658222.1 hypothetical protein AOBTE_LOCUS20771 [Acanthoscelides obtectus]
MLGDCGGSFIAALDVGTTTVRCQIFNSSADTVGAAQKQLLKYLMPRLNLLAYRRNGQHSLHGKRIQENVYITSLLGRT